MKIGKENASNNTLSSKQNMDNTLTMITSDQADSFIYSFHAGVLPLTKKLKFLLYLALNRECRHYVRSYKNTIRITKDGYRTASPIEKFPKKLLQIIINSQKSNK